MVFNNVSKAKALFLLALRLVLVCSLALCALPAQALANTVNKSVTFDTQTQVQTTNYSQSEEGESADGDQAGGATLHGSESISEQTATEDITQAWQQGSVEITTGGTYVLSANVNTTHTLRISAPAGQCVTLDFAGFSACVQGSVTSAVEIENTGASVVLTNSAKQQQASETANANQGWQDEQQNEAVNSTEANSGGQGENNAESESANSALSFVAENPTFACAAVRVLANNNEQTQQSSGEAEGKSENSTLKVQDVSIKAKVVSTAQNSEALSNNQQQTNSSYVDCYGIYLQGGTITLAGAICVQAQASGSCASLYAATTGASANENSTANASASDASSAPFKVLEGSTFQREVSVFAAGNAQGTKLVEFADAGQAQEQVQNVKDATGKGSVVVSGKFAVVQTSLAGSNSNASSSAQAANSNSTASDALLTSATPLKAPTSISKVLNSGKKSQLKFAEHSGNLPMFTPAWVRLLAAEQTSLASVWVDRAQTYTISESGTYYIDSDFTTTSGGNLVINGNNIDVDIVLNGHTLAFDLGASGSSGISIVGSANVNIVGSGGKVTYSSGVAGNTIVQRSTGKLSIQDCTVEAKKTANYTKPGGTAMHAINAYSGTINVSASKLVVDQSNLVANTLTTANDMNPAVIFADENGQKANISVEASTISCIASPLVSVTNAGTSTTTGLNAYGIYLKSQASVDVRGTTISSTAAGGSAYGIAAKSASVANGSGSSNATSINVNAANLACGIYSLNQSGVLLNGALRVTFAGSASSKYQAALGSEMYSPFVLGKSFSGSDLAVLLGSESAGYNLNNDIFATFSYTANASVAQTVAAHFTNALGSGAACTIEGGAQGIYFTLDAENAPVEVVSASGTTTPYSSVKEAFAQATNGCTVRLLADAGDVVYSGAGQASSEITLDLCGHTITSFESSSNAAGIKITSSEAGGKISQTSSTNAALFVSGSANVVAENINVISYNQFDASCAVQLASAAMLTLNNVAVTAQSASGKTVGLSATNNSSGSLVANSCSVLSQTVNGTSIAYGVQSTATRATFVLNATNVGAQAALGTSFGVDVAGSFEAAGTTLKQLEISASTQGTSGAVAVRSTGASDAHVSLTNCNLVAKSTSADTAAGSFWCMLAPSGSGAQFALDGNISVESTNNTVLQQNTPVQLGAGFALASGNRITTTSGELDGDVFATLESGANASACAQAFEALSGSAYENCSSNASGQNLVWSRNNIAKNKNTGALYTSVGAALQAASAGDTVELTADAQQQSTTCITTNVVLDLCGHTCTINAGASATSGAIALSGAGALTVTNSAGVSSAAALNINVGSANETSSAITYSGISVASTGAFALNGATLNVTYTGNSTQAREINVAGVQAKSGAVKLENGATLNVNAQKESNFYAASGAFGIYVPTSTSAPAINVDATSCVNVENNAKPQVAGNVESAYSDGTLNVSQKSLKRIQPDESSSLYKEILQKFREQAQFDSVATSSTYGARIYYATKMQLDDGTFCWAFSNYVAPGEEKLENIVPAVIFMQAQYNILPTSTGISALQAANVNVAGTVSASSQNGAASGVNVQGQAACEINGASITAAGGSETYQKLKGTKIDLGDYIDAANKPSNWFYSKNSSAGEVVEAAPASSAVNAATTATLTLAGAPNFTCTGANASDVCAASFSVALGFTHAGSAISVGNPAGENSAGSVFATPASSSGVALDRSWFVDAYKNVSVAAPTSAGSLAWEVPYTVVFNSETETIATFEGLVYGSEIQLPDPALLQKDAINGVNYEFVGWAKSANATKADVVLPTSGTVVAEESATYYPVYETKPVSVAVQFTGARTSTGSVQGAQTLTAMYGKTIAQSTPAQVLPQAADFESEGATFRFVGWRDTNGTVWDAKQLASSVVFDYNIPGAFSGNVVLSAYYVRVAANEHLVTFKVDNTLVAYAASANSTPTYFAATNNTSTTPSKQNTQTGKTYSFAGWAAGWVAATTTADVAYSPETPLPSLTGDVTYTACFSEQATKVKIGFYYYKMGVDGTYVKGTSDTSYVDYGSSIDALASTCAAVGSTFVQAGMKYTMLGWSVRETDAEPMYTTQLPAATGSSDSSDTTMYYAIYSVEEQVLNVNFYSAGSLYVTAADCTASSTVDAAFKKAGKANPTTSQAGYEFKGWASTEGSTSADVLTSDALSLYAANDATLNFYAVFAESYKPTVTFVDVDGTTVLQQTQVISGLRLVDVESPMPSAVAGQYFKGWKPSNAQSFDATYTVQSDIRVVPVYAQITTNAQAGDEEKTVDGTCDVSQACLVDTSCIGASYVEFSLSNVSDVDTTISTQAQVNGDSVIGSAVYRGVYKIGQNALEVSNNTGNISVTLSAGAVNRSSALRIYWKDAQGIVRYTSALRQDNGYVSFTLASYSALGGAGNIAVAEVGTVSAGLSGAGAGGSSGGGLASATSGGGLAGATTSAGLASASLGGSSNSSGLSNAAQSSQAAGDVLDGVATTDGVEVADPLTDGQGAGISNEDINQAMQQIAGNPIAWVVALLIALALGAGAWWFFIGKRRKGGEQADTGEDDEAGWSDDKPASGKAQAAAKGAAGAKDAQAANSPAHTGSTHTQATPQTSGSATNSGIRF